MSNALNSIWAYAGSDMSCVGTVKDGSHIMAIYIDLKEELEEAFEFLKRGLQKSEVIMLITDAMSKEEILDRMSKEWGVESRRLESTNDIIVKSTREWYFPDGMANADLITKKWQALASMAAAKGKTGLRVFGDTSGFFTAGLSSELVDYEASLPATFEIPLTAICAYSVGEIDQLASESIERLVDNHGVVWA